MQCWYLVYASGWYVQPWYWLYTFYSLVCGYLCLCTLLGVPKLQSGGSMDEQTTNYKYLSWNVRGLNATARQEDVKQVNATSRPDLICLQETKMGMFDNSTIRRILDQSLKITFSFSYLLELVVASCLQHDQVCYYYKIHNNQQKLFRPRY